MLAWPALSRLTTMFLVSTVGGAASWTATVAGWLAELPLLSVTVRVTMLVLKSEHAKREGLMTGLVMSQFSVEPLSTSPATMLAWPALSRLTTMFLDIGRAACRERAEISVVAVSLKKKILGTVRVTMFVASCEQNENEGASNRWWVAQLLGGSVI